MTALNASTLVRWSWRAPLVRGSLLLMEALWVYALVAFLVALTVGGGEPSFIGTLVVVAGSYTIARVLQDSVLSLGVLRVWGALLSLLVFYAVVRLDFYGDLRLWDFGWADAFFNHTEATLRDNATAVLGVPLLLFFWGRGVLMGQQSLVFEDVVGSFAIGVVVVAGVEFFGSFVEELPEGVRLIAVPYIAVGLVAIGLSHAARSQDESGRDFMPSWLLAIGGTIGLLAVFSLLFVLIDFDTARQGLEHVAYGIGWAIAGLMYLVAWPLFKLFEGLFWLIDLIANPDLRDRCQWDTSLLADDPNCVAPEAGEPSTDQPGATDGLVPGWVRMLTRYFAGGVVALGIALALAFLFNRFAKQRPEAEVKESVYSEGRLGADLSGLLGSMLGRFRRGGGRQHSSEPVRRLYFEMLAVAESRGTLRLPAETPLDFAPRLQRVFGSSAPGEITALFDEVRYGARDAPPGEVERLRAAWEQATGR